MHYKLLNKPLSLGIFAVLILIFFLGNQLPDKYSKYLKFTTKVGASSYNISNKWHYKFNYLDGKVNGRFTAKNENAKLIYSGNIEEGTIVFILYNRADSIINTFPVSNITDTLVGFFQKGGKYKIQAIATKAKGRFDFKLE